MTSRVLAAAAALWGVAYLVAYLAVVRSQLGTPAWWYAALVVVMVVAWAVAAARPTRRGSLLVGVVIAAGSVLVGLLSVGLLLMPALVAAIAALGLRTRLSAEPQPGDRRSVADVRHHR